LILAEGFMNSDWKSRYQVAQEVARAAGDIAKTIFDGEFDIEIKADQSPVTIADKNAEAHIRQVITSRFPGDGFLGEEYGDEPSTTGYRWIIDPIDGTKSFVRKVPIWGTLLGLEYRGELIAGVAYIPTMNQLFHALRGAGAYRDSTKIAVSQVSKLSEAHMCYSSVSWFREAGMEKTFLDLASSVSRSRGFGDFYGFLLVAQGSFDFMIDTGVHAWDIAALIPILQEAGGQMTDWSNRIDIQRPDTLASNGLLHETVRKYLEKQ
jgi:histidinol-phosphatase